MYDENTFQTVLPSYIQFQSTRTLFSHSMFNVLCTILYYIIFIRVCRFPRKPLKQMTTSMPTIYTHICIVYMYSYCMCECDTSHYITFHLINNLGAFKPHINSETEGTQTHRGPQKQIQMFWNQN